MAHSANGYTAGSSLCARYTVPGTSIKVVLHKGDVSVVLLEVMRRFNNEVQKLRSYDTGGYAYRDVRGRSALSNHASGTAVDLCWRLHPLGARGTYSSRQRAAVRKILNDFGGVVRWGGDYSGRKDEMHFEINASPSRVKAMANKIRAHHGSGSPAPTTKPVLKVGSKGTEVRTLQTKLHIKVDGSFGPVTKAAVQKFQKAHHLGADGEVGPLTRKALGM